MGRRYFCEYCDKTFIDDLDARKKHLKSTHHCKLRKLHYELHRDPRVILAEESVKTACRRFLQHGECQFAGNCKYTHYTAEELWTLKQQSVECEQYEKRRWSVETLEVPSFDSWLEKYNEWRRKTDTEHDRARCFWTYPEHLECRSDLPPSLRKFKEADFKDNDFAEWGV